MARRGKLTDSPSYDSLRWVWYAVHRRGVNNAIQSDQAYSLAEGFPPLFPSCFSASSLQDRLTTDPPMNNCHETTRLGSKFPRGTQARRLLTWANEADMVLDIILVYLQGIAMHVSKIRTVFWLLDMYIRTTYPCLISRSGRRAHVCGDICRSLAPTHPCLKLTGIFDWFTVQIHHTL